MQLPCDRVDLLIADSDNEVYRAWQHMGLSGFIQYDISGENYTEADQADIGINVPSSKRSGVGYFMAYEDLVGKGSRNEIQIGGFASGAANTNSAMTSVEAHSIDVKMDDGIADKGKVLAANGTNSSTCITGGNYDLLVNNFACRLSFLLEP